MSKIVEFLKAHPWEIAGGIFAVGAGFIFLTSGSSGTAASSLDPNAADIASATQLQGLSIQAQQAATQTAAAAGVANNQTAAGLQAVQIQAQTQQNADTLSASTTQAIAALEAQTQQLVSTLSASVANNQTSADVSINANNNATQYGIAALPYQLAEAQLGNNNPAEVSNLQNQINALDGFTANLRTDIINTYGYSGAWTTGNPLGGLITANQSAPAAGTVGQP